MCASADDKDVRENPIHFVTVFGSKSFCFLSCFCREKNVFVAEINTALDSSVLSAQHHFVAVGKALGLAQNNLHSYT